MCEMTAIQNFLNDIDCLAPITKWVNKVNVFEVLGLKRAEIRHSNMLAWLMDPKQNHGLGDRVLRGIIELTTENRPGDYSDFSIRRESNNIDLLAISDKEKYILCIENKTYSDEHDDQLGRYKRYIEGTFPGYRTLLLYLTPKKKASSDPENWLAIGYADILTIIGQARKEAKLQPEAKLLIDNYAEVIGDLCGGNENIQKKCTEIYTKHQIALDLILANTGAPVEAEEKTGQTENPELKKACEEIKARYGKELDEIFNKRPRAGSDPFAEAIRLWGEIKTDEGVIEFCPENTSEKTARFKTKIMSDLLPDVSGINSSWNTDNCYFYEIRNTTLPSGEHELFLQMVIGYKNMPDDLRKTCDRINQIFPTVQKMYSIHLTTDHVILKENTDRETIMKQLDSFLEDVRVFEKELTEKLPKTYN